MSEIIKNKYSDKELNQFKVLIEEKIEKAKKDLKLLKSTYMNDGNNGTDDTSPLSKLLRKGQKPCPKKQIHSWL